MLKKYWIIIFFAAILVNLIGTYFKNDITIYCSKPLLVSTLMAWLYNSTKNYGSGVYLFPLIALFFSFSGDVWLMFEKMNALFFIIGLICFLISHVFYILLFNRIRKEKNIPINWWWLIIIFCYYSSLLFTLFAYLGNLKIPVVIYGAVISTMLFMALQLLYKKNTAKLLIVTGAICFIASDSILAFNKFYSSFNYAGLLIMLTYAFAQYFITRGVIENCNEDNFVNRSLI